MPTTTEQQVIVGKMSLPQAGGQVSLFSLPQSFSWLQFFTAEEIAEFLTELLDALHRSQHENDWSLVADVLAAWKATADLKGDTETMTAVAQGMYELSDGKATSWQKLREELGL